MKKFSILLAVVILFAAGVSYAVAHWTVARVQRNPTIRDAAWLKCELNLTELQAQQVEKLETVFQNQLNSACGEHCSARVSLGDELAKPAVNAAEALGWVEKMNAAQAASERATLDHILQIRALLNEQQAQRFSKLIQDQICNMSMGAY